LTDRVKELGQQIALSFAEIDEKNLSKLISSLQVINSRITHDVLNSENQDSPPDEISINRDVKQILKDDENLIDEKKLYAEKLNSRISANNTNPSSSDRARNTLIP
jgi:hypothetical protein